MRWLSCIARVGALLGATIGMGAGSSQSAPNVVLIICDDLNDYVTGYGGHPQARTPSLERFAQTAVAFSSAYSNNPVCAPSRSSFMTGIHAHRSGNLFFGKWYENPVLRNSKTLMEHFRDNGYRVVGSGKVMHHHLAEVWDEFGHLADYGPVAYDGKGRVAHPSVPRPYADIGAIDGSFAVLEDIPFEEDGDPASGWIYGKWGKEPRPFDPAKDLTPDERNAAWAAERIGRFAQEGGKPFFLAVGFIRPHTPLHVRKKHYDLFPLESVELPTILESDASDTHYRRVFGDGGKGLRYYRDLMASYEEPDMALRTFTQAYLASVAAVDACIGTVLGALDQSSLSENTVVVVTSDHGWNMGQKDYLFKNSPWEESCRVPLFIRAPGMMEGGGVAKRPVSLIDLYPTLVDICGLTGDNRKSELGAELSGHSLRPFLENPGTEDWDGPDGALSMIWADLTGPDRWNPDRQHWSLRTQRWRYILYNTGAEELYDHGEDPHEWRNVAGEPRLSDDLSRLRALMHEIRARP